MMVPAALFLCLLTSSTATFLPAQVGISYVATLTKDVNSDDFIVVQVEVGSNSTKIVQQHRLEHSIFGSPSPGTTGYYPDSGEVLVGGLSDDLDWHLTTIDLSSGKVIHTTTVKDMVIEGIMVDHTRKRTWVAAFLTNGGRNYIYEWKNGQLVATVPLGKLVVEIGMRAYSSKAQTVYLTLRDDDADSGLALISVSLTEGKVMTNVPLADTATLLMWDEKTATLYAWVATETAAGMLTTVDVATGKRLKAIATFPALSCNGMSGASSVLLGQKVYATMINISSVSPNDPDGVPVNLVVDLATGDYATTNTKYFAMDMVA